VKYYKGEYKYITAAVEKYDTGIETGQAYTFSHGALLPSGGLTIEKSYAWDGPSGPTFDTSTLMRGSLVHDCLYQLLRETDFGAPETHGERRKQADQILYQICIEDGMWKWRAKWILAAVRKAGNAAAVRRQRKIYEAP
jgi:hypothetical protein